MLVVCVQLYLSLQTAFKGGRIDPGQSADIHNKVNAAFFMLNIAVEVLFEWMRREEDDLSGVHRAAEPL